eukprot:SAG31_NODE_4966_length_2829_cov_4.529304_4_plen_87_part_00
MSAGAFASLPPHYASSALLRFDLAIFAGRLRLAGGLGTPNRGIVDGKRHNVGMPGEYDFIYNLPSSWFYSADTEVLDDGLVKKRLQ